MKFVKYVGYLIPVFLIILFIGPLNKKPQDITNEQISTKSSTTLNDLMDGKGTKESPYIVGNGEDLNGLRDYVNQGNDCEGLWFEQKADIDMMSELWPTTIGDREDTPFRGKYIGNGHTVQNLNIITTDNAGLFGYLEGTVSNLCVGGRIESKGFAGGIAGTVTGKQALIYNCYNEAEITGYYTGGIAGRIWESSVVKCFNSGELNAISGDELAGINVGYLYYCIAKNQSDDSSQYEILIADDNFEEAKTEFRNISMEACKDSQWSQAVSYIFEGDGTRSNPFCINNIEDLIIFRNIVNSGYEFSNQWVQQRCDIDLQNINNWEPIGCYDSGRLFDGIYDGAGYKIYNIKISSEGNVGFFGQLKGTVLNLGIESGKIQGACVGAIASHSYGDHATIANCYNNAWVEGTIRAGGIADNFMGGKIINCINYGKTTVINTQEGNMPLEEDGEIVSYAGTIIHCVLLKAAPGDNEYIKYEQSYFAEKLKGIDTFLNGYLYKMAWNTGYQNDNFVQWKYDGKNTICTQIYAPYRSHFFLSELGIMAAILLMIIFAIWIFEKKTPYHQWKQCINIWNKTTRNKRIIYTVFWTCITLVLLGMLMGDHKVFGAFFWPDSRDTFMDFFNPLYTMQSGQITLSNFYNENTGGYPPIARFMLWLLGNSISRNIISQGAFESKMNSSMLFVILILILIIAFIKIISKHLTSGTYNILTFVIISAPMLYAIERGNIIIVSFILTLFYVMEMDSQSVLKKHMAYLALSVAAGIKLYPAVYGLLLLTKHKWKEAVTAFGYGISVFIFPFLFTGGLYSFKQFMKNLGGFSTSNQTYARYWLLNYKNIINGLYEKNYITQIPAKYISLSLGVVVILLIGCTFVLKTYWKKVLSVTLILILVPGANAYYSAIFYSIPLILAFNEKDNDKNPLTYIILGGLCLALAPLQFLCGIYGFSQENIQQFTALLGIILAFLLIINSVMQVTKDMVFQPLRMEGNTDND